MGADCVIVRHPASGAAHRLAALGRQRPGEPTGTPTVDRQRGRRHPRAPHPGAAGRGHAARPARRDRRAGGSGSSATCCTAGSPAPTSSCSRRWAPRSCWSRRRRCCPSGSAQWPCRVGPELDAELPAPGRGDDAARAGRADARGVLPVGARVRGALRPVRATAPRCCPSTPWCCTPGRWCAAWRSRRRSPTRPTRAVLAAGAQRRPRAHGRPLPPARSTGRNPVNSSALTRLEPRRPAVRRGRARRRPGPRRRRRRDRAGLVRRPAETLDADGLVLLPGFVDLHTHLREPGGEESETDRDGLGRRRARRVHRGVRDAQHRPGRRHRRRRRARAPPRRARSGWSTCTRSARSPSGCAGERMAELGTMAALPRAGADVLRRRPVRARPADHAPGAGVRLGARRGDRPARRGPPAHRGRAGARGRRSRRGWGSPGWPATAEETIVARDCALAREAGARLHVCHVSTRRTRSPCCGRPRPRGVRVTAEVTPHHLLLTDARAARLRPGATRSTRRCAPAPTPRRCARRSPRA